MRVFWAEGYEGASLSELTGAMGINPAALTASQYVATSARREAGIGVLGERFERAQTEGDLKPDADADALARYLTAIGQGISCQAVGGATRDDLHRIADHTLNSWPSD
ncbi:MAG: hypothetical protein QOH84_692 [Kribbellaceae bacterium]|nr:hypothetical protein [Kribbellaceae bacterium]